MRRVLEPWSDAQTSSHGSSGACIEGNEYYALRSDQLIQSLSGVIKAQHLAFFGSRYQVDPACSHMLVPKIKPCMSKYIPLYGETANGSLYQL